MPHLNICSTDEGSDIIKGSTFRVKCPRLFLSGRCGVNTGSSISIEPKRYF